MTPRDRLLADLARRGRIHRRLRRVHRPAVPGLDRRRLRRPRGGHRQRGDVRRAGPVLGDRPPPMIEYIIDEYDPDLVLVGYPVTDEFQHQFLGLVTPTLPGGAPNPAYDDVQFDGVTDGRVASARPTSATRLRGRGRHDALAREPAGRNGDRPRSWLRPRLRAAVPGDRRQQGPGRPRAAVAAADLELPPGDGRDDRQGQGLLGRGRGPDLPQPRPAATRPAGLQAGRCRRRRGDRGQDQGRVRGPDRPQRLDR